MGDSKFYFFPMVADGGWASDTDDLETITIPKGSTICEPDPTGEPSIPTSGTGRTFAAAGMRGWTVRIKCDLGNDIAKAEAFMAMVSYMKEGGLVGFALDSTWAWAVQLDADLLRGDVDFDYGNNIVETWESITDPVVGWRCLVQSALPQMRREIVKLDGVAAGNATIDGSLVFAYSTQGSTILVRHKFFFPFLRYLSGDVVLSEPTGSVYRFEATFDIDVGQEHILFDDGLADEVETIPSLIVLAHFDSIVSTTDWIDDGDLTMILDESGSTVLSGTQSKFGARSMHVVGDGGLHVNAPDANVHPAQFNIGAAPDRIADCWIRTASNPAVNPRVIFCHERNSSNHWALLQNTDGTISYVVTVGGSDTVVLTTTTAAVVNTWSHVGVSSHANVSSIFIDGNIEESDVDTTDYNYIESGAAGSFWVGNSSVSGDSFEGYIDEFRFKSGAYIDAIAPAAYSIPTSAYSPP